MRNQLKLAALALAVVVGMVLYKERHDRKEREKKKKTSFAARIFN